MSLGPKGQQKPARFDGYLSGSPLWGNVIGSLCDVWGFAVWISVCDKRPLVMSMQSDTFVV